MQIRSVKLFDYYSGIGLGLYLRIQSGHIIINMDPLNFMSEKYFGHFINKEDLKYNILPHLSQSHW